MDEYNQFIPPHLNAEAYRTDTTGSDNVPYLDYIRIHSDGTVLIGCSELTGRYWDGRAHTFTNIEESMSNKALEMRCISLSSGTADGCFIGKSNRVLLCEDNGSVSLWTNTNYHEPWHMWILEKLVSEHDAAAMAVDCLTTEKEYVTVGADGNAKIWDISEMICIKHYDAHTMIATGVSVRPNSTTEFATSSHDHYMSLWDINNPHPVLDIVKNDCGVRCLQWLDENKLVYGDEAGILSLVDIRNNETSLKLTEFPAAVHKLAINAEKNRVAVCCDNSIVSVCEIEGKPKCEVIYNDRHMHGNFVRGLAWDHLNSDILHSVGWDSEIKSHTIV